MIEFCSHIIERQIEYSYRGMNDKYLITSNLFLLQLKSFPIQDSILTINF